MYFPITCHDFNCIDGTFYEKEIANDFTKSNAFSYRK